MRAIACHFPKLRDPRYYQIAVLSLLLSYGTVVLDFGIQCSISRIDVAQRQGMRVLGTMVATNLAMN
jgi:hypothetical protein